MNTLCDPDKEREFLACVLQDLSFASRLDLEDLTVMEHRTVLAAAKDLLHCGKPSEEPIIVRLRDLLASAGQLEAVGGPAGLDALTSSGLFGFSSKQIAVELRILTLRRRVSELMIQASRRVNAGEEFLGELVKLKESAEELKRAEAGLIGTRGFDLAEAEKFFEGVEDAIKFVLDPLLVEGGFALLQGKPKSYKSTFALYLALMLALGLWNAGAFEIPQAVKVLYIGYEDGRRRLKQRLLRYMKALGISRFPASLILAEAPRIDLAQPGGVEELLQVIRDQGIRLLVIDPLVYIHSADENSAKEMQPVCAALKRIARQTGCVVFAVHHVRKPTNGGDSGEPVDRGRGSSTISAAADVILDWKYSTKARCAECEVVSKDVENFKFKAVYEAPKFDEASWNITRQEDEPEVKSANLEVVRDAVLRALVAKPTGVTRNDLASYVQLSPNTISRYLDLLVEAGLLTIAEGARNAKVYAQKIHPSPVN